MGGLMSRRKGRKGEQQTATEIREALPELADQIKRGWQSRFGCDDPDVCGLPGIWLEVKKGKQPNPRAALKQATEESIRATPKPKQPPIPVAVIRDDRKEPFACMRWPDLLELIAENYRLKNSSALQARMHDDMIGAKETDGVLLVNDDAPEDR